MRKVDVYPFRFFRSVKNYSGVRNPKRNLSLSSFRQHRNPFRASRIKYASDNCLRCNKRRGRRGGHNDRDELLWIPAATPKLSTWNLARAEERKKEPVRAHPSRSFDRACINVRAERATASRTSLRYRSGIVTAILTADFSNFPQIKWRADVRVTTVRWRQFLLFRRPLMPTIRSYSTGVPVRFR